MVRIEQGGVQRKNESALKGLSLNKGVFNEKKPTEVPLGGPIHQNGVWFLDQRRALLAL
jgi:hypothetical protein